MKISKSVIDTSDLLMVNKRTNKEWCEYHLEFIYKGESEIIKVFYNEDEVEELEKDLEKLNDELGEMAKSCEAGNCTKCKYGDKCCDMSEEYTPAEMLSNIEKFEKEQKELGNRVF